MANFMFCVFYHHKKIYFVLKSHSVTEMNSVFDRLINRLHTAGDTMSKLEEMSTETSKTEM